MTELELNAENIAAQIVVLLRGLAASPPPDDSEGPMTNLAHLYRMRGIAQFLLEADVAALAADLQRSVQARTVYLQACARGAPSSPRFRRTTRNRAFFDALAVNDLAGATELAELCDGIWVEELEYEDDFLFVDYLQKHWLVRRGARPAGDEAAVVERFEEVLEDPTESPFYELCGALERKDARAAEEALRAIMQRRAANYEALARTGDLPQIILHTERFLDVQGVGVVRLAAEAGLALENGSYPRIPAEVVAASFGSPPSLPADAWSRP